MLLAVIATVGILATQAGFSHAADQEIMFSPSDLYQPVGSEFMLTVTYDVSDNDDTLTSLGIRIHFDSTKLEFMGYSEFFEGDKLGDPQLQEDAENRDDEGNTDKIVLLGYSDPFNNGWPNHALPLNLVTLSFRVKNNAEPGSTKINVSQVTGHVGYGFLVKGGMATVSIP